MARSHTSALLSSPHELGDTGAKVGPRALRRGQVPLASHALLQDRERPGLVAPCSHSGKRELDSNYPGFEPNTGRVKRVRMNHEHLRTSLEEVFALYADSTDPTTMGPDGVLRLCDDLGVEASDLAMLVVAWRFKSPRMGWFTKRGFVDGMIAHGCSDLPSLRDALPTLRQSVHESRQTLHDFYAFAFTYSLEPGQKCLYLDVAIQLWEMILTGCYEHIKLWTVFLQEHHKRAITRDTWVLFLAFTEAIDTDMSNFSDQEAWPVLIDEFVEFAKAHLPSHN